MNELDRELLELAAKVAGIDWHHKDSRGLYTSAGPLWSPLADDGDALRLAARLKIDVLHRHGSVGVRSDDRKFDGYFWESFDEGAASQDATQAATRRVIVRAAAEIGRGMQ